MNWPRDITVSPPAPKVARTVTRLCKKHTHNVNMDACAVCGLTGLQHVGYPLRKYVDNML